MGYESIYSEISGAVAIAQMNKGAPLNAIYLGSQQMHRLKEAVHINQGISKVEINTTGRARFFGINVYVVDDEDHLKAV